ncbi:unnamed protein product [Pleuronectes platessa]|uniref:Uncharacterized protein n=1 Tax=Pleuronectes platessa TaxID=8262 RepID=A0A9N7VJU7_PLEPL|nr:unnamed protein product [Pleuronectes platessa]
MEEVYDLYCSQTLGGDTDDLVKCEHRTRSSCRSHPDEGKCLDHELQLISGLSGLTSIHPEALQPSQDVHLQEDTDQRQKKKKKKKKEEEEEEEEEDSILIICVDSDQQQCRAEYAGDPASGAEEQTEELENLRDAHMKTFLQWRQWNAERQATCQDLMDLKESCIRLNRNIKDEANQLSVCHAGDRDHTNRTLSVN